MVEFDYLPAVSLVLSFASIFLVIFQLHNHTEQRKIESLMHIYDVNRQLLMLGFSKPELFDILQDSQEADPVWERRYLQLWFNQLVLIYFAQRRGLFQADLRESLERDIRDFMAMDNMRRHWRRYQDYYPSSFRDFANALVPSEAKETSR